MTKYVIEKTKFGKVMDKVLIGLGIVLGVYVSALGIKNKIEYDAAVERVIERSEGHNIILTGEEHHNGQHKKLIGMLDDFKKKGVNDLAIEIDRGYQSDVDAYMRGEMSFKEMCIHNINSPEYIFEVVKKCKKLKINVHCIDYKRKEAWTSRYGVFIDQQGTYIRDKKMFEQLDERIFSKNPDAKLIYFGGRWHIHKEPLIWKRPATEEEAKKYGRTFIYAVEEAGPDTTIGCYLADKGKVFSLSLLEMQDKKTIDMVFGE